MKSYVLRRLGYMVLTLVLVSIFSFIVIQLPPGDYVSAYISRIQSEMGTVDPEMVEGLRKAYGLDKSMMEQYFYWMGNIFRGDFGTSFEWKRPVLELILDRLPITLLLSVLTTIVYLRAGNTDRYLFGAQAIFHPRLYFHGHWLYRSGNAKLLPSAGIDVFLLHPAGRERGRHQFPGVY